MTLSIVRNYKHEEYTELGQRRPCKFAFAKISEERVYVLHKPVLCRDFLNDTLVLLAGEKEHTDDNPFNVYGYTFTGPIYGGTMIVDEALCLRDHIDPLWNVEQLLGFHLTKIDMVDDTAVLQFDPKWMTNTVMFSWYTSVLRGLSYDKGIKSLNDIPREAWMVDSYETFINLWKHFKDMPNLGVSGCSDEYLDENSWEDIHEFNGWFSNTESNKRNWTRYGNYFYERLRQA
jgi:hypothetical protein